MINNGNRPRPSPGSVSIRPTGNEARGPMSPAPRSPAGVPPSINPRAFRREDWEDGHTGETPADEPVQPVPEQATPIGIKPYVPPQGAPRTGPAHPDAPRADTQRPPAAPRSPIEPAPSRAQMQDIGAATQPPEDPPLNDAKKAKYVKGTAKDANYVRVDLPSKHVFYDFQDVFIRPFKIKELSKIWLATQENSFTHLVDAMDATLADGVDLRDLLPQDFKFLMYWHRINSYPRSPFTIDWTSKYGDKLKHTVRETNLDITTCTMSRDEVEAYREYGLVAPTVRDVEVLKMETMTPDQEFLWERAQYVVGNSIEEKLARLDEFPDLEVEDHIYEFSERLKFGVTETVTVLNTMFDPMRAITGLREQAKKVKNFVESNPDEPVIKMTGEALLEKAQEYETEAEEIEEALAAGKAVRPAEEQITLTVDAMNFFPRYQR